MADLRILALDPATATGFRCAAAGGTWFLAGAAGEPTGRKLARAQKLILTANQTWGPFTLIAAEEAASGSNNRKTALFHAKLLGLIELVADQIGARVVTYHNGTIKSFATGNGHAKKPEMMRAYRLFFKADPRDDNECDARFIYELAKQEATGVFRRPPPKPAKRRAPRKLSSLPLFSQKGC